MKTFRKRLPDDDKIQGRGSKWLRKRGSDVYWHCVKQGADWPGS